ncbi:MAG: hypothetical protein IPO27_13740 [Bacteroidetes bacterium]|nr:hypothetical protein [Bacteroidota bacterium]
MRNLFSKHVMLMAIAAFCIFCAAGANAQVQQNQQSQQIWPDLTCTTYLSEDCYVFIGDKIYLCQKNVLTKALNEVIVGKTIFIKRDGTYINNGVSQKLKPGARIKPDGQLFN